MESTNTTLAWIPALPLLGALINLVFGRWLSRGVVHFFAVAAVAASFGVVLSMFITPGGAGPLWEAFKQRQPGQPVELYQHLYWWIEAGSLKVNLAFRMDTLSAVMCLVVTGVGTLIHIYSTGYMADEKRYASYFGYLNLFTGAMLLLVLGANLPVMFIGWEGVGVCSYLLIGFWYTNDSFASAGRKAFVVNRIGDFAFLLGMFLLFWATKDLGFSSSLDFGDFRNNPAVAAELVKPFWGGERLAAAACILLFIGACGKSAQFPLFVWLPDAMAGPTPVSALIHAATMVTAGVYMVARLSWVFALSTTAMFVVATVGLITALLAAFMAFAQTDLKRVLAYSTVSQLGFMFVGVGTGNWVPAIFHLGTHAFFKAGLFLGAGSVMHGVGHGDIMKMGGLKKWMPVTRTTFLIYCLAIAGIVPFAGFFSKDEILAGAFGAQHEGWPTWYGEVLWVGLTLGALGTAFYMWRLYFLVFEGDYRGDAESQEHIHESPPSMTIPLVVLAFFTVVAGLIGLPHVWHPHGAMQIFHGLGIWLEPSVNMETAAHVSKTGIYTLMGTALAIGAAGIGLAWWFYGRGPSQRVEKVVGTEIGGELYKASYHKLWFDEIYDRILVRPFRWLATGLFKFVDRFLIDTVLVNGSAQAMSLFGRIARWVQNGQVQRYMVGIIVGAALIFFLTGRATEPELTYKGVPAGLELKAYSGSGIAGEGARVRWDLDGDGAWDLTPEAKARIAEQRAKGVPADKIKILDQDYVSDPVITRRVGEVGPFIRAEITDPVTGSKRTITRHVVLEPVVSTTGPAGEVR